MAEDVVVFSIGQSLSVMVGAGGGREVLASITADCSSVWQDGSLLRGEYGADFPTDLLVYRIARVKVHLAANRGKGYGSLAMEKLAEFLDSHGFAATLEVVPYRDQDRAKLEAFYLRHGFEFAGAPGNMRRLPRRPVDPVG